MPRFNTQTRSLQPGSQPFGAVLLLSAFPLSASAISAQPASKEPDVRKPQPAPGIVSIPNHKLALLGDARVCKVFDVVFGAHVSPSPGGEFQIAQRLTNPTYCKPGVAIDPGTDNPIGRRWPGFEIKGFGSHGTNRPASNGKNVSLGCIRLRNFEVEALLAQVCVDDHVSLPAERTEEVAQLFGGEISSTKAMNDQLQVARGEPSASRTTRGSE